MDKIIIEVREGLIDAVYSTNTNITVRILNHDNVDTEDMTDEQEKMQSEIETMKDIL